MNARKYWRRSTAVQKGIYCLYIISFLIATSTHTRDLILGGFLPYKHHPLWANIYWTALTFLDPLAVILLLTRFKQGLRLYALVIVSDVVINLYFTITISGFMGIFNLFMLGQLFFLFFLLATWKAIQKGVDNAGAF